MTRERCGECNSVIKYGHHWKCSQASVENVRKAMISMSGWNDRYRKHLEYFRKQIIHYQGLYSRVKHENNKLRAKLSRKATP